MQRERKRRVIIRPGSSSALQGLNMNNPPKNRGRLGWNEMEPRVSGRMRENRSIHPDGLKARACIERMSSPIVFIIQKQKALLHCMKSMSLSCSLSSLHYAQKIEYKLPMSVSGSSYICHPY